MEIICPRVIFLITLLISFLINSSCSDDEVPRVGIIGAGIGGTSAAFFLQQLFGGKVKIDIFEKQHVGGRLAAVKVGEEEFNAGGTIIHPANLYMLNFTEMLGLKRDTNPEAGRLGLYDGNEIVFSTSAYSPITLAKLFWRYGMDIYNIRSWVQENILNCMTRLYKFQATGHAFSTVEDLLNAMCPHLVQYGKTSIKELLKKDGFSDRFIEEFVMGALRVNYGQTTSVHGLVGSVSMAGVEPGLWNVVGGNQKVPQGLLGKSGANLIRGKVTSVSLSSDGSPPVYQIDYLPQKSSKNGDDLESKEYDIVILATPFYKALSDISFVDFQTSIDPVDNDFHLTVATFMQGLPNASYFNVDSLDDLPSTILTTKENIFFNSLTKMKPVNDKSKPSEKPVYRMFTNHVPNVDELKQLVPEWSDLRVVNWMAYPEYSSTVNLPSFTLHDQMYHINAIEMAASAMEMSVVGAKNVALLAYYRYFGHYDKIDEMLSGETATDRSDL
ncbi:prenylcysteine oxidase 1-like [Dreissena polymorpha]|uniref:prenylcysteine oxidase 1-like n=1 Tax=Dreissena polymorpha TaxID=45954 RepID=UPI00226495DD|nr:prenylcysteine oxidase 1-like [Dreissena polymorpha]